MSDETTNAPALDWSTAEVSDGKLIVGLDGELPSGWRAAFESTVGLLARGEWTEVKLKPKRRQIRVGGVSAGTEDRLHHFLESAVQQANATLGDDRDSGEPAPDASEEDLEMRARFRSFAAE
jgi:hypothetical protein